MHTHIPSSQFEAAWLSGSWCPCQSAVCGQCRPLSSAISLRALSRLGPLAGIGRWRTSHRVFPAPWTIYSTVIGFFLQYGQSMPVISNCHLFCQIQQRFNRDSALILSVFHSTAFLSGFHLFWQALDLDVKNASSCLQLEIWLAILGLLVGHCLFWSNCLGEQSESALDEQRADMSWLASKGV